MAATSGRRHLLLLTKILYPYILEIDKSIDLGLAHARGWAE